MVRSVIAAVVGAVLALVAAFLVVAVVSAVGGVPVLFDADKTAYGWDGAQYGIMLFVAIGLAHGWPFPAILLAGAVVGVLAARAGRSRVIPTGRRGWMRSA